ncbi:MAG: hypothetical protein K2H99_04795, partial [Paramuribaculum sp.]|nr:hypothetical protein [Paramuribaculum sp.]
LAKGTNDSRIGLAEIAFLEYDFDGADEHLDEYESGLKRGRRKAAEPSPEAEILRERIERGRNMMERVEQLTVIDSIAIGRDDFFRIYRLSKAAGRIAGAESLHSGARAIAELPAFITEDGRTAIWSAADENENYTLMQSTRLDDGSWDEAQPLGDDLGEGGDAAYPFLMSDGVTLYFANDGENSLGGYDIFMTRNNGEEYLQPQNIGMPYNSPYDDYMLAIDEESGIGWWATDRNRLGDSLTIYRFIPREMRVNYPADTAGLAGLAIISDFRATQQPGADYSDLLSRAADKGESDSSTAFTIAIGSKIYHDLNDFRTSRGRTLMTQIIGTRHKLDRTLTDLKAMRRRYAAGEKSLSQQILDGEATAGSLRREIKRLTDELASAER